MTCLLHTDVCEHMIPCWWCCLGTLQEMGVSHSGVGHSHTSYLPDPDHLSEVLMPAVMSCLYPEPHPSDGLY